MKWSNSITLEQPLTDVRLVATAPAPGEQDSAQAREKAAYEQGRRDMEQAMGVQLLQQRNEIAELQNGLLNSLKQMLPKMAQEMESALIQLALEAAEKITAGMKMDPKRVEAVVREALSQVQDASEVSIRINPDDLGLLRKHKSPLVQGSAEMGPLRFVASPDVTRGGCIVQTRFGLIDAQQETKLAQLRKAVNV